MRRLLVSALLALVLLAACSPNDEGDSNVATDEESSAEQTDGGQSDGATSDDDVTGTGGATETISGAASDFASANADGRPEITVTGESAAPGSLLSDDLVTGSGAVAEAGDLIEVHYVGALAADGMVFDASWDRSETFFVPIGTGALIPGWDQGLLGMAEGGRRLLVIPPDLAYGSAGAGGVIGPDATLVFVVDLLQIVESDAPAIPDVTEAGAELELIEVEVGEGELVEAGDTITVNYQGNLLDGTVFDSSWQRGQPFTTVIGIGQVIPGWDEGMVGMREGGRRILVIPSDLAYGETGAGGLIGPNTPLVFVVDLLRVQG